MLKKFILHLILFFPLILCSTIIALDPIIKYPTNPLPFSNQIIGWNELGQYQPSVIFENGIFKMWYASYNGSGFKIIYSTSIDGINWTRQNLLDLYPGFDNHDPAILKTENGYTMFFVASTNVGSQNFKIYKINSNDGISFEQNSRQLVLQPETGLETNGTSSPSVIFKDGSYYLFYLCWGPQGFRTCLATSLDGNIWQRCANNPIISEAADGPSIFRKDDKYYIFFHSPLGLRQAESNDNLSCTMSWTNFKSALSDPGLSPSVTEKNNLLYFYYSGFYPSGLKINLATSGIEISPTSTLTPTLSPTLTPSPTPSFTPTPTPLLSKKKVVIIPGMFSSWNGAAILHNMHVPNHNWRMPGFIKEYDGLIRTLENLDYNKNEDFFVFNYDWRKNIESIADDLNDYLEDNNLSNSNVDLLGHSLGGLVARFYGQKYGTNQINKIVTVGSPHLGTANAYKIVEAGEIDSDNSLLWLMQKFAIQANRKNFKTDKNVVASIMPVSKDLFPIHNFLEDQNSSIIPIQNMIIKNLNLLTYAASFSDVFPKLTTYSGNNGNNTLTGFKVNPRSTLDILLDNYPDGHPVQNIYDQGDEIVSSFSTIAGNDANVTSGNHGEIIYKKDSIDFILTKLGIPHNQSQIIEGRATKISPALIFALFSPATLEVESQTQLFEEEDGLIFIENASAGVYRLKVKGKYPGGKYRLLVGQISNSDNKWFELTGEINIFLPFLQTDEYTVTFTSNNLKDFPVNEDNITSLFDLLIKQLRIINQGYENVAIKKAIDKTFSAKKEYAKSNFMSSKSQIIEVMSEVFKARLNASTVNKNELYNSLTQIENLYQKITEIFNYSPTPADLQKKLDNQKELYAQLEIYLLNLKNKKINVFEKALSLSQMSEKLIAAEQKLTENNLSFFEILLLSSENLSKEVK